ARISLKKEWWSTRLAAKNFWPIPIHNTDICRCNLAVHSRSNPVRSPVMIADFESFKIELSLSKIEICRELYHLNRDMIRIKKEAVAVKNLVRIIDSTLRLTRSKGFDAMSL